jgi:hypothetical protein
MQKLSTRTKVIFAAAACLVVVTAGYAGTASSLAATATTKAAPIATEMHRLVPAPGAIALAGAACVLLLLPKRSTQI